MRSFIIILALLCAICSAQNLTGIWNFVSGDYPVQCCIPQAVYVIGNESNLTITGNFSASALASDSCISLNVTTNFSLNGNLTTSSFGDTNHSLFLPNSTELTNNYLGTIFTVDIWSLGYLSSPNLYLTVTNVGSNNQCYGGYVPSFVNTNIANINFTGTYAINSSDTGNVNVDTCCYPSSIVVSGNQSSLALITTFNSSMINSAACTSLGVTGSGLETGSAEKDTENPYWIFVPPNVNISGIEYYWLIQSDGTLKMLAVDYDNQNGLRPCQAVLSLTS